MSHFAEFTTITSIILVGIISPGPDFLLITKHSLLFSKKAAIFSALGISMGTMVHTLYSLIGLGFIISESLILFSLIKYLGAIYLVFLAFKSFNSHPQKNSGHKDIKIQTSSTRAFIIGFLTDITNPKAILFYLSLFTLVIKPTTSISMKMFYGLEVFIFTFIWFSFIVFLLSYHLIANKLQKFQNYLEKFINFAFLVFGLKLIFVSK